MARNPSPCEGIRRAWRVLSKGKLSLGLWLPYDTRWSKNSLWRTYQGHIILSEGARELIPKLAKLIQVQRVLWLPDTKMKISLMVERPDMRADPANFIDGLLDGIKRGTKVDDRYYAVGVDWVLKRGEMGALLLAISQEESLLH